MKKSLLASKAAILRSRPLVVGTLTAAGDIAEQIQQARNSHIDVVELRLDGFRQVEGPFQKAQEFGRNVIHTIQTKTKCPVLLTLRAADEGGSRLKMDDRRRGELLSRLMPSTDLVDVEIRHAEFARRLTVIAHLHGVDVIHSAHDFSSPGVLKQLNILARRSRQFKGDVFKVAVTPRTLDEMFSFLRWGKNLPQANKILIGMGAVGRFSRVAAFSFGSIFTYGYLGRSAAPGQLSARALAASVRQAYLPAPR